MLAEIDRRGRTEGRARPGGPPPGILRGAARGAPIECFGSFDLELRDERNVRRKILASRGLSGAGFPFEAREWPGVSDEEIIDALLYCEDESDLRARLRRGGG